MEEDFTSFLSVGGMGLRLQRSGIFGMLLQDIFWTISTNILRKSIQNVFAMYKIVPPLLPYTFCAYNFPASTLRCTTATNTTSSKQLKSHWLEA